MKWQQPGGGRGEDKEEAHAPLLVRQGEPPSLLGRKLQGGSVPSRVHWLPLVMASSLPLAGALRLHPSPVSVYALQVLAAWGKMDVDAPPPLPFPPPSPPPPVSSSLPPLSPPPGSLQLPV